MAKRLTQRAKVLTEKVVTVVDKPTRAELRNLAAREGSSEGRILRLALRDYLARSREKWLATEVAERAEAQDRA